MAAIKTMPKFPEAFRQAVREAQRQTAELLASDPSRSNKDLTLPIFQFRAKFGLLIEEAEFEAGDKNALLAAIHICATHCLVLPEWLAKAYISEYDKVLRHEVGSWDDAFGRPFPKGKHLNAARKKREKAGEVWHRVRQLHDQGRPIDEALFEEIGKEFALGKTLVSEYYYYVGEQLLTLPAGIQAVLDSYKVPEK